MSILSCMITVGLPSQTEINESVYISNACKIKHFVFAFVSVSFKHPVSMCQKYKPPFNRNITAAVG